MMGFSLPWFLFGERPCVGVRPMRKVIEDKLKDTLASFRDSFIAGRGKLARMRSTPRHSRLGPSWCSLCQWMRAGRGRRAQAKPPHLASRC